MNDTAAVAAAANRLSSKDESSLLVELGMRENAIAANPALKDQADLHLRYDSALMGPLDDLKALGRRILARWSKELHGAVCGAEDSETRKQVMASLNLGEAAVIAAVAGALIWLAAPAALAAALAPLIVKKIFLPAGEELCEFWAEAIDAAE